MNRIASIGILDASSSNAAVGSRRVCCPDALYTMWPTTLGGGHFMYALAFVAAQQRVQELLQNRASEPNMN